MIALDDLAGGFAILIVLSLVFLAIGFFVDSVAGDPLREEMPPTRIRLAFHSFCWMCLAAGWAYLALSEWQEARRDWPMLVLGVLWAIFATFESIRTLRDASQLA